MLTTSSYDHLGLAHDTNLLSLHNTDLEKLPPQYRVPPHTSTVNINGSHIIMHCSIIKFLFFRKTDISHLLINLINVCLFLIIVRSQVSSFQQTRNLCSCCYSKLPI